MPTIESYTEKVKNLLSVLKYTVLSQNRYIVLLVIFLISIVANYLIFVNFKVHRQLNYEYAENNNCYIEVYTFIRLIRNLKPTFLLFLVLTNYYWFYVDKKDLVRVVFLPISKWLNFATAFVILLIFQLCFGAFLLYLLNYQFDQFILKEDWVKITFSRASINSSILLEVLIFSTINTLNILTMVRFFPRIKTIIQIIAVIYLTFNNYILPGSDMYENAKNLCKDK
jgi:hypothetical protein